jgi:hypothetical protein
MSLNLCCRLGCQANFGSLELGTGAAGVKASEKDRDRLQGLIILRSSDSI